MAEKLREMEEMYRLYKMCQELGEPNQRSTWVREWVAEREDEVPIYKDFEEKHPEKFQQAFRMSVTTFYKLLSKLEPIIRKKDTQMRPAIPAKMRLQVNSILQFGNVKYSFQIF